MTPSFEQIQGALTFHLSRICEKLRKQNSLAGCLTVYLRTDPHRKTPGDGYPVSSLVTPERYDYLIRLVRPLNCYSMLRLR
ncbi:DinB/UmuC family translesion DNA polymerase [Spirosoma gilvum]